MGSEYPPDDLFMTFEADKDLERKPLDPAEKSLW